ncbi:MAG: alpha-amylase [Fibrobacter sp.]|nr:alpha-amylase [Fibrobacter sp.]
MSSRSNPEIMYNFFPRLVSHAGLWVEHLERIAQMGFNSIYINPVQETGGSRSLYAVKNYFRLNTEFLPPGADPEDFSILTDFIQKAENSGITVYTDLVLNHTANESVLIDQHPEWFKRDGAGNIVHPYAIDPANPSNITVWGDLSEIDYENSQNLQSLIKYWDEVIGFYQKLGFSGFRCDAAYKVPGSVFIPLINAAKKRDPKTRFFAETLGCTLEQVEQLRNCGFDYLFNSCKWWNFDSSWCLDQHRQFKSIAPSIGFPESHDTLRTPSEQPGTLNWQKNRYILASVFSKGILMPMGYEYGSYIKIDVVNSRPEDLKKGKWDICDWITRVNMFKASVPVLCQEGEWQQLNGFDSNVLFLIKKSDDSSNKLGVLINKDWYNGTEVSRNSIPGELARFKYLIKPFTDPHKTIANGGTIDLGPSEIVFFTE